MNKIDISALGVCELEESELNLINGGDFYEWVCKAYGKAVGYFTNFCADIVDGIYATCEFIVDTMSNASECNSPSNWYLY